MPNAYSTTYDDNNNLKSLLLFKQFHKFFTG